MKYTALIAVLFLIGCTSTKDSGEQKTVDSQVKVESTKKETILSEQGLGNLTFETLGTNTADKIKEAFPKLEVFKTVGHQDGPDYDLYEVSKGGEEVVFYVSMDWEVPNKVHQVRLPESSEILDQYGVKSALTDAELKKLRTTIKFHADLHYNIYGYVEGSKIKYKLKGNFKSLENGDFVASDYSVTSWQVEGMTVEYLIWQN